METQLLVPQVWPTRREGRPQIPLPAEWPQIIQDMGSCSPRNMRLTFSSVPGSSDLLKQARMPFAVLVQPLAPTQPGEEALQVGSSACQLALTDSLLIILLIRMAETRLLPAMLLQALHPIDSRNSRSLPRHASFVRV